MEVIISGASGIIGRTLTTTLEARGDTVWKMVRRPIAHETEIRWDPENGHLDPHRLLGAQVLVHLAGAGIAESRWTAHQMDRILESRTRGTRLIAEALAKIAPLGGPNVLISGSAIGFYGDRGEEVLEETSPRGTGFLADVCVAWENATREAERAGLRVAHARTGVVLAKEGGILSRLLPIFRARLGGRIGPGNQFISWISLVDEIAALLWMIDNEISGPVNLVAPKAVTNSEFSETLGILLGHPKILRIPPIGPMILYGRRLVTELMLASTLVRPGVLSRNGFSFKHASLKDALNEILIESAT